MKLLKGLRLKENGVLKKLVVSVAIISFIGCFAASYVKSYRSNAIEERGNQHVELVALDKAKLATVEDKDEVKKVNAIQNLGKFYDRTSTAVKAFSMDKKQFKELKFERVEGRLPKNEDEVVISEEMTKRAVYNIGDNIDLYEYKEVAYGEIIDDLGAVKESYKIVGVVAKSRWHEGDSFVITSGVKSDKVNAFVTVKDRKDCKEGIASILGFENYKEVEKKQSSMTELCALGCEYNLNHELIKWDGMNVSDDEIIAVTVVVAVVWAIMLIRSLYKIVKMLKESSVKFIKKDGVKAVIVGALAGCIINAILLLGLNILGIGGMQFKFSGFAIDVALGTLVSIVGSIVLGLIVVGSLTITSLSNRID